MWWTLIRAALADDLTVGPLDTDDHATLEAAVAAASPGDRLLLAGVEFVLTGPLVVDGLVLEGVPGTVIRAPVALETDGMDALLTLQNSTRLVSLEVSGSGVTRPVRVAGTTVLTDVTLGDGVGVDGGNLEAGPGTSLRIEGGLIRDGVATNLGGGVYTEGVTEIVGTRFEDNLAIGGGGVFADIVSTLVVDGAEFVGNEANGPFASGAALFTRANGAVVTRSRFAGNVGIYSVFESQAPMELSDSVFVGNTCRDATCSSGVRVLGTTATLPTTLRRLRFCDNHPASTVGEDDPYGSLYVHASPVDASNLQFFGTDDSVFATGDASVTLDFASWIRQDPARTTGTALRVASGDVSVARSVLHDVAGEPFEVGPDGALTVTDTIASGLTTPPAGVTASSTGLEPLDGSACAWWIPEDLATRNAFSSGLDPDGTPGSYGATGGPAGPPEAYPDADGDGWSDDREAQEGTDPSNPDTDGDDLADSVDPEPSGAEGDGPQDAPTPRYGLGCAVGGGSLGWMWWLAPVALGRRRVSTNPSTR